MQLLSEASLTDLDVHHQPNKQFLKAVGSFATHDKLKHIGHPLRVLKDPQILTVAAS
jgi:hypothetical protein